MNVHLHVQHVIQETFDSCISGYLFDCASSCSSQCSSNCHSCENDAKTCISCNLT